MNRNLSLLDNEDIAYFTSQENLLRTLQIPLLDTLHQLKKTIEFSNSKRQGMYQYESHFYQQLTNLYEELAKKIEDLANDFVLMIEWYLENKYDVSLDLSLGDFHNFKSLSIPIICLKLEKELNGMTFQEKSLDFHKKTIQALKPINKGKIVELQKGFHFEIFGKGLSMTTEENLKVLFKGISLYETGKKDLNKKMNYILENHITKGELDLVKTVFFNITKNGKCQITFKSIEDAVNFTNYYK